MEEIKKWLANHSITAKTVATVYLFLDGMFYTQPSFHDYLLNAYNGLPKGIHGFFAGVLIPGLIFWRTQKRTTITAEVSPGETKGAAAVVSVDENASKDEEVKP